LNPRPTAPQAAILSKLNYGPLYTIQASWTIYELHPSLPYDNLDGLSFCRRTI